MPPAQGESLHAKNCPTFLSEVPLRTCVSPACIPSVTPNHQRNKAQALSRTGKLSGTLPQLIFPVLTFSLLFLKCMLLALLRWMMRSFSPPGLFPAAPAPMPSRCFQPAYLSGARSPLPPGGLPWMLRPLGPPPASFLGIMSGSRGWGEMGTSLSPNDPGQISVFYCISRLGAISPACRCCRKHYMGFPSLFWLQCLALWRG